MSEIEPLDPEETDLTTVKGIGDATAEELSENGYERVGDLIDKTTDTQLSDIDGVASSTASDIHLEAASRIYQYIEQTDDTTQTQDESTDVFVVDSDTTRVELTIEDEFMPFVVHVLFENVLYQHRMSNEEKMQLAQPTAFTFAYAFRENDSEEYTFGMSDDALGELYSALRRGVSDYGSRSGVTRLYGTIHELSNQVNEYR